MCPEQSRSDNCHICLQEKSSQYFCSSLHFFYELPPLIIFLNGTRRAHLLLNPTRLNFLLLILSFKKSHISHDPFQLLLPDILDTRDEVHCDFFSSCVMSFHVPITPFRSYPRYPQIYPPLCYLCLTLPCIIVLP